MRAQRKLKMETSEDLEAPNTNSDSKSPLKGDVGCGGCFLVMLWPDASINLQLLNQRQLLGDPRKTITTLVEV